MVSSTRKKPKKIKKIKLKRELLKKEPPLIFPRLKIKVLGIGGGGASVVSEMAKKIKRVSFTVADTDARVFKKIPRNISKFQFGEDLTKGMGTGMNPELGEKAALSARDKIEKVFKGQDFLILVSCLGGGVGSGAGPVFSEIARTQKNISIGIFTSPFGFEGDKKMRIAKASFERLKENLSGTIFLQNEKILNISAKKTPLRKSLSLLNQVLISYIEDLIEIISCPGIINIDFADLRTVLSGRGRILYFGQAQAQGQARVEDALKQLFQNPFFESPQEIKRILFNIAGGKDLGLAEVEAAGKAISEINPLAKIIFGISICQKYAKKIKITFLGAGESAVEGKPQKKAVSPKEVRKKIAKERQKENQGKRTKVRRTAVEVKKEEKEKVEEELASESDWEVPAFLKEKM